MHAKSLKRPFRLIAIVTSVLVITGCGDGSGPQRIPATAIPPTTGILIDAVVSGADWQTSGGESGITTTAGEFSYVPGELVTFSVGGIVLGTAPGAPYISAVELTGSNNPTDQAAINQFVFLQSIDDDQDPSNGINISSNSRSAAAGQALNFSDPNFRMAVAAAVAAIAPGNRVVSDSDALAHFYSTYSSLGGTDTFSFSFPGFAPVSGGVTYDLVFADEFDEGTVPDPNVWSYDLGYGPDNFGWGNNEWQLYTDSTDNVRVENGNLVISALCPSPPCGVRDGTITSGRIQTQDKFEFRYGTVIARIKPPVGDGAWPAFWALGANHSEIGWPRSGEIDFMEMHNAFSDDRTTHFTMHWCDETVNPSIGATGLCFPQENGWTFFTQNRSFPESLGDDFHIFEADWNENRIIGRIDGIPYFEKTIDPGTMEEFLREFFMILNVATGGTLGSDSQPPNGNEVWPQTMLVDYVRVFQRTGQGAPAEDTLIDFENAPETYDFGPSGGFGGGASAVIDNPVSDANNDSAQVGRMLKFNGEVFAGSLLTLDTPVPISADSTITMKVWSPRQVNVLFKIEGPAEAEIEVTHGGMGWEELSFDFGPFVGSIEGISLIFDLGTAGDADNDPDNWTFYFDDILIPAADTGGGPDNPFGLVADFEGPAGVYNFGPELGFGGGVSEVLANPVSDSLNDSAQVVRMRKFGGEVFAGSLLTLPTPLTIPAGTSFTMKVWSQRPVMVLFKLEPNLAEVNLPHSGSGWELMTFEFPDFSGTVEGLTFIFDLGILGDADNNPTDWTFYFDEIVAIAPDDGGGPDPTLDQIDLPITFDDMDVDYTVTDFGDPVAVMTTLVADPDDAANTVASTTKPLGAPVWAGTTMSTTAGLATAIPFSATETTIGVRVYSPDAGVTVRLKADNVVNGTVSVETEAVTTVANQWETLIFDFTDQVADTPALDLDTSYTALSIFFNFGVDGDTAGEKTYLWDDVEFGVLEQIDLPITFDDPDVDYTLTDFGDPVAVMTTLIADPGDAGNTVASTTKPLGAPEWAGTTVSTTDGLATPIPFSSGGVNSIGVRVYSPDAGIPVRLKADDVVNGMVSVETEAMTTVANQWETLVFNFDDPVAGTPAINFGTSYTALSIFFNFGTDGNTAGAKTYLWDDVEFGVPIPDTTAPMLNTVSIVSNNTLSSGALATTGDEVTVTLTADEPIAAPTVTIAGVSVTATGDGADWQASRVLDASVDQGEIALLIEFADTSGNPGTAVSATTDASSVVFDNVAATLSITGAPALFTTLDPVTVTFQFSEDVTGFELADIDVTNGAAGSFASTDAATYMADITPDAVGAVTIAVAADAALDLAGNGSETVSASVPIDMVNPGLATVSIVSDNVPSGGTLATTGNDVTVMLVADEPIVAPVITIAGESVPVSGAGTTWEATRTALATDAQSAIGFTINFADLVGNPGAPVSATTDGSSVIFDNVPPTVAIEGTPMDFTTLQAIPFTVAFSEPVTGFVRQDIAATGGTVAQFMGSGDTYTATVTPSGVNNVVLNIGANAAIDAAGNQSQAASTVTITGNVTAPVLTFVGLSTDGVTDGLQGYAKAGNSVTLSMTAPEDIDPPTVTIAGVSVTPTGMGTDWQATRVMEASDDQDEVVFQIDFVTTGGVDGLTATAVTDGSSVIFDSVAPTISIDGAPSMVTTLDPIAVTLNFSEDVTGFDLTDIVVTNGSAGGFASTDAATYTADITPDGNGGLTIDVAADAAIDVAANGNAAASLTVPIDTVEPGLASVSIVSDNTPSGGTHATTGDEVTVMLTADEPITAPTVIIAGESFTATGAGTDWQASRIAQASDDQGAIAFEIQFADLVGNSGTAVSATTDMSSVIFDNVAATLSIDNTPATIGSLDPFTVTFQFGEDVSGFALEDIDVTNGSAAAFASTDAATYTADITPAGTGDVTIAVAADAAADIAGNGSDMASVAIPYTLPYWSEIWVDDFDDAMQFAANWTVRTDADCPDPCTGVQSYVADRVSLDPGASLLTINAQEAFVRGGPSYTSGLIDTRGSLEIQHGRIEIDVQLPAGTAGITPSLWMLPATGEYGPWPLSGEIDIANAPGIGSTLEHTLRYGLPEPEDTTATGTSTAPAMARADFFTYAIEWEAGEIRWFVDGTHVATQIQDNWYAYSENADGVYTPGTGAAPFDQDFYLLLSLAVDTAGGMYPQSLQVDAVRVYECVNGDPVLGTGCVDLIDAVDPGVMPVVATPAPYNGAPYTEALDVYTDALATLDFVDEDSMTTAGMLVAETFGPGVVNIMTGAALNVAIDATSADGGVRIVPGTFVNAVGSFDLSGGETAGELLFSMRVNSATGADPQLTVRLNSDTGSGEQALTFVADAQYHDYSVKISDLVTDAVMQGGSLNLASLSNLFEIEAASGNVNFDLDDISVKVACRDDGGCEATPRLTATAEVVYSQDFEGLDIMGMVIGDGWTYFVNVFDPSGGYRFGYGGPAPNGPQISAIADGQGGPDQGSQQLNVYSDYNCCAGGVGHMGLDDLVETNVFQEPRGSFSPITAADVGTTWTFNFDAKFGNVEGASQALAFFKVLDPASGFSQTAFVTADLSAASVSWTPYSIEITIGPWVGQILQFGFQTNASNFEGSGIFYDNVEVTKTGP